MNGWKLLIVLLIGLASCQRHEPSPAPVNESAEPSALQSVGSDEWVLATWTGGEPAPAAPVVTLRYQEGRLGGKAACNRYSGAVTPGAAPEDISVGPVISTKMACADSIMVVESRFLDLLSRVKKLRRDADTLALAYELEGASRSMSFVRRDPSTTSDR